MAITSVVWKQHWADTRFTERRPISCFLEYQFTRRCLQQTAVGRWRVWRSSTDEKTAHDKRTLQTHDIPSA